MIKFWKAESGKRNNVLYRTRVNVDPTERFTGSRVRSNAKGLSRASRGLGLYCLRVSGQFGDLHGRWK
jgi:hypothetical protein